LINPAAAVDSKGTGKMRRLAMAFFVRSCQWKPRRRGGRLKSIDATVAEATDAKSTPRLTS